MILDVNPFLIELLGYRARPLIGKKVWELGSFKDIVANQAILRGIAAGRNTSATKTCRWKRATGGGSRWSSSATCIKPVKKE